MHYYLLLIWQSKSRRYSFPLWTLDLIPEEALQEHHTQGSHLTSFTKSITGPPQTDIAIYSVINQGARSIFTYERTENQGQITRGTLTLDFDPEDRRVLREHRWVTEDEGEIRGPNDYDWILLKSPPDKLINNNNYTSYGESIMSRYFDEYRVRCRQ